MRKIALRLCYPGLTLGRGVTVDPGVSIHVSGDGSLTIGSHTHIGSSAHIHAAEGVLTIGDHCFIGRGATIVATVSISIGDDGLIGEYVTIRDHNHVVAEPDRPYNAQGHRGGPITIGKNVWLGAKATILQDVAIGDGAIVGANSVVTRSVPAATTVVGAPARPIGRTSVPSGL